MATVKAVNKDGKTRYEKDGDKKILRIKKTDDGKGRSEKNVRKENGKKIRSGKKER